MASNPETKPKTAEQDDGNTMMVGPSLEGCVSLNRLAEDHKATVFAACPRCQGEDAPCIMSTILSVLADDGAAHETAPLPAEARALH